SREPAGMFCGCQFVLTAEICLARKARESLDAQSLPGGLHYAGDLSLERQRTEAQTADAKLAQIGTGAAAQFAAVVLAGRKLRLASVFYSFCSRCHISKIL